MKIELHEFRGAACQLSLVAETMDDAAKLVRLGMLARTSSSGKSMSVYTNVTQGGEFSASIWVPLRKRETDRVPAIAG